MFEAYQHIRERNIKESFQEARDKIADEILFGSGFKLGCEKWTMAHVLDLIYEHGDEDQLAVTLHAITSATGKEETAQGKWALEQLLRNRMEEYLPDSLVEEVAKEMADEASLSVKEAEHKERNG